MKKVYLIAAIIAVLCGFVAYRYLDTLTKRTEAAEEARRQAEAATKVVEKVELTKLVTAVQDIPAYTAITKEMVALKDFPAEYVPENAALTLEDVLGKMADGTIFSGELLMLNGIGTLEEVSHKLAGEVPEGMRAMTVGVDSNIGVGGYITRGDRVDLLFYVAAADEEGHADSVLVGETERLLPAGAARVLLEDVEVLRLGMIGYDPAGGSVYTSLTLALTPEECERVYAASQQGSFYVTLRRTGDEAPVDSDMHSVTELLGSE